jgi:hypothetical protein
MLKNRNRFLVFAALVLVLALTACSGGEKIKTGRWEAKADFGSFAFTVNPEGTKVTYLEYEVPECGNYSISGNYEAAWEGFDIIDAAFNYGPDDSGIALSGTFDPSGESASGEWRFSPDNCSLSGSWEAVPVP